MTFAAGFWFGIIVLAVSLFVAVRVVVDIVASVLGAIAWRGRGR
jgi:hypothetical protein